MADHDPIDRAIEILHAALQVNSHYDEDGRSLSLPQFSPLSLPGKLGGNTLTAYLECLETFDAALENALAEWAKIMGASFGKGDQNHLLRASFDTPQWKEAIREVYDASTSLRTMLTEGKSAMAPIYLRPLDIFRRQAEDFLDIRAQRAIG